MPKPEKIITIKPAKDKTRLNQIQILQITDNLKSLIFFNSSTIKRRLVKIYEMQIQHKFTVLEKILHCYKFRKVF